MFRLAAVYVGLHVQDRDTLIDPRPAQVGKLHPQSGHLADHFKISGTAIAPLLAIHEDAHVKHDVHTELRDRLIEWNDLGVVGVPVGRDHLDAAQAKLVIATPHLFDHQLDSPFERAACQPGDRIQDAEAVKPFWSATAQISTIVVMHANVVKMLIRQLRGAYVEQRGKNESLFHFTYVQASHYSLGTLFRL